MTGDDDDPSGARSGDEPAFTELLGALAAAPPAELPELERYRLGPLLGEGGCGQVYRAFDLKLQRDVALKFLTSRDPALLGRLLREAQAQARVDHPSVCKVYEIVETGGRPFISMQLISGRTLAEARAELSVRERVRVVAEVAQAIEAAHQLGIIHRDLKPANIMLEKTADGLRPFVMDFGLARDLATTMTQATVGTPSFMSPEQARGDAEKIGPRTDVYGLGATLYAVLVGEPPFSGESTMQVLARVESEEPRALRSHDARLPRDLEVIVHTCLQKDPRRRYLSAAALARDLDAWSRGEPIVARPERLLSRWVRRARRHRVLAAVSAAGLTAALVFGGVAIEARRSAAARVRLTRELADESNQIDSMLRIASLLPLHDTAPERARIRARMESIAGELLRAGASGRGPGLAAIGRGHLALREYPLALARLQAAYDAGDRDPDLEYALGKTLGHVYQMKLAALRTSAPESQRLELRRLYRDPALDHLKRAAGTNLDAPEYVEGLIALYDERYEDAAEKARAAFHQANWLYEALQLEGDAYIMMGRRHRVDGDLAAARRHWERAAEPLRRALEIAHSDDQVYVSECRRVAFIAGLGVVQGALPKPLSDQAIAACDRALAVNPDNIEALKVKADLLSNVGEVESQERSERTTEVRQSIALAERAAKLDPAAWDTFDVIGEGYEVLGEIVHRSGQAGTARAWLEQGVAAFRRSHELRPNARAQRGLGVVYAELANEDRWNGRDPRPRFAQAVDAQQRALAMSDDLSVGERDSSLFDLGGALVNRATWETEHGFDPTATLAEAKASLAKSDALRPNMPDTLDAMGGVAYLQALYQYRVLGDPTAALDEAARDVERATELNPKLFYGYTDLASTMELRMNYLLGRGRAPGAELATALATARRALAAALKLSPRDYEALVLQCRVEVMAARAARVAGVSAGAVWKAAEAACGVPTVQKPGGAEGWLAAADEHRWRAEFARDEGERRRESAAAERAADEALRANKEQGDADLIHATVALLEARHARGEERRAAGERAVKAFERAFGHDGNLRMLNRELVGEAKRAAGMAAGGE